MPDEDDDLPPEEMKRLSGIVPDIVRRAVLTGVGALFMTEEGIRNLVGDMKMPKDALAFLIAQADKTRSEVARVVTHEVRRFLESETLRREMWKLLTGVTLEVKIGRASCREGQWTAVPQAAFRRERAE